MSTIYINEHGGLCWDINLHETSSDNLIEFIDNIEKSTYKYIPNRDDKFYILYGRKNYIACAYNEIIFDDHYGLRARLEFY